MNDLARADFRGAIERHFAALFRAHAFAFVAGMNERAGEYQEQIAASPDCQMKFILEQDAFALHVGRVEPHAARLDGIGEVVAWHPVQTLMLFEDELHPEQAATLQPAHGDATLDEVLQAYATLLEPYLPRLLSAFSARPPAGWWTAYEAFASRPIDLLRARPGPRGEG